MKTISYTELRSNLATVLDSASSDREPCLVTRPKWKKSVIMSYDDYSWLIETAYLLSTKANRENLEESIAQIENWEIIKFSL